MRRLIVLLTSISVVQYASSQIYLADNGLTSSGTSTSTKVSLGGTLNNTATAIDFGSSNSSSNFSLKKGSSSYLFVTNDGKVGIGNSSPASLLDINGSLNVTGAAVIGVNSTSAPAELDVNYNGAAAYAAHGIRIK